MIHNTTEGSLAIALELATQTDCDSYATKSPMEQHAIKMHFINELRLVTDQITPLLEIWMDIEIAVDSQYHESLPSASALIAGELSKANAMLDGVNLSVGGPKTPMHCAKTFDCGHICGQSFALVKQDSGGTADWTISRDGVTVAVTANLEWITPPA